MTDHSRFPISALLGVCLAFPGLAIAAEPVDFNKDIRPLLSDKCFLCHGPDASTREADLRLDDRTAAIDFGVIVPGDPGNSELLARVLSDDPSIVMPPPSTGKTVTPEEAEKLRRWIAADAPYTQHWAFVPPVRPEPPSVSDPEWVRSPIDQFVLAKLDRQGLKPSPEADTTTLIRRLSLDLVGLPPSPEQLRNVKPGNDPQALERHTERLLASQHYGEHWARWWLDAARYADSDGYEKDKQRSVWFYRDYVIDAMNRDLPYDQFIIEQVAGDLLPNATQRQKVATGFLRNSMVNEEGGVDPEQFRVEGMFDRMDAIGKAVLGLTTQCAQCHTHKYDPISHREYYQMFAALNDFHEASITVFTPEQAKERDRVLGEIARLEQSLKQSHPDWQKRMAAWEAERPENRTEWKTLVPDELPFDGQKFRLLADGSVLAEGYAPSKTTTSFPVTTKANRITAIRIDLLTHPQLPRGGPGRSTLGTAAITEFDVTVQKVGSSEKPNTEKPQKIKFVRAISDVNPAHTKLPEMFWEENPSKDNRVTGPAEYAIDGKVDTGWSTDLGPGRRNQDFHAIFVPEKPIELSGENGAEGEIVLNFTLRQTHGGWNSNGNQSYILGRYRLSATDAEVFTSANESVKANESAKERDSTKETIPSAVEAILKSAPADRTAADIDRLFSYWRTTVPEFAETNKMIESLWQEYPDTDSQLVAQTMDAPRKTAVFNRGDFLSPGESVSAAAPNFLHPMPQTDEPDRLRFARWLADDKSPTTARAIVNRIWQSYFGRGLVTTPEDLGFQSPSPSHPELLDWLAVELMENGWSLKHIHRIITDSATYRQSSRVSPQLLAADPYNTWLARGPRVRVNAEVVRDIALTASGLLNPAVGGPSVYPPAPEFLFLPPASYGTKIWNTETDGDQFRRSLYIHAYRSVPFPVLQAFDAPKGDFACVRRERSNTPLQALIVLNEPQFVECAAALAARVLREQSGGDEAKLRYAHLLCVGREPLSDEVAVLKQLLEQQRRRIDRGELKPLEILANAGQTATTADVEPEELAPWLIVARVLLNLDETITKE